MKISSVQNPTIKNVVKLLQKSGERKRQNKFVVEGIQENYYALNNNFKPIHFFIEPNIYDAETLELDADKIIEVSADVYKKLAYRDGVEGIVGLYHWHETPLDIHAAKLLLILEGIEKPGNLGAILRSSEAFGVDGIILTNSPLDIFNPNVIRSSVGTVFSLPILSLENEECQKFIKKNHFVLYGTRMQDDYIPLNEVEFNHKAALLFGTEHSGISGFWKDYIDVNFLIPMKNSIDSLNLSNSIAISLYAYDYKT